MFMPERLALPRLCGDSWSAARAAGAVEGQAMDAIVAERATLTIDQVLEALATANSTLPVDAMQWSLDNWDIAAPHFLTLLDAIANGADPSRRDSDILFFALHMMGEKRETAAFPP